MELWPRQIWKWKYYSCHPWKRVEVQAPTLNHEASTPNSRPAAVPARPVQVPTADTRSALACALHPAHSLLNLRLVLITNNPRIDNSCMDSCPRPQALLHDPLGRHRQARARQNFHRPHFAQLDFPQGERQRSRTFEQGPRYQNVHPALRES